mmetsp:Transcript_2342/g.3156  ORF Transcript_2342/g.3156 Transcript_2342/m.3156 type:complete len:388 (+) Transcript_2342:100-1263(+)
MALGHKRSGSRRSDVKGQKNESNILVDQDELKSNKIKTYFCIVLGAAAFLAFALVSNERFQSLDERLQHLERLLKTELGEVNQSDKLVSDSRQCSDDITVTSKTHNKRHNLDIRQKSLEQIKFDAKLSDCKDRESADRCAELAKAHGCNGAPGWMAVMCGATCDVCELLDPHVRCTAERVGMAAEPAFKPGEIGEMFSGLQERFPQYNVTYLSMPPEGPWVARIDNFLSDEEVEALIVKPGLVKRSTDQGSFDDDGVQTQVVSRGRTSENAWCMGACEQDKNVVRVTERISNITTVPSQNFESFQLLRYQAGQEYRKCKFRYRSFIFSTTGPTALQIYQSVSADVNYFIKIVNVIEIVNQLCVVIFFQESTMMLLQVIITCCVAHVC